MVSGIVSFYAQVHPCLEIILHVHGPAFKRVIPAERTIQSVAQVGPIPVGVRFVGRIIAYPVAPGPASPSGLMNIVHTGRDQIEELRGVSLFLQGLSFFHNTQHGEHSLSFPGASTQCSGDI